MKNNIESLPGVVLLMNAKTPHFLGELQRPYGRYAN